MELKNALFAKTDIKLTQWMARNGILFLRLSVGIIFLWYGFLKFFPDVSSAESIATRTIEMLSFGIISGKSAMIILATWETLIGLDRKSTRLNSSH